MSALIIELWAESLPVLGIGGFSVIRPPLATKEDFSSKAHAVHAYRFELSNFPTAARSNSGSTGSGGGTPLSTRTGFADAATSARMEAGC